MKLKNGNEQHELTAEDSKRGGCRSTFAKSLVKRKNCTSSCEIYPTCPLAGIKKVGSKSLCALNAEMPKKIRDRVVNLFQGGKGGAVAELRRAIFDLSVAVDQDKTARAKALYIDKLVALITTLFGQITKIETDAEITVRWKGPEEYTNAELLAQARSRGLMAESAQKAIASETTPI